MQDLEYIKLAGDEILRKFVGELRQDIAERLSAREPDGSPAYVQATLGDAAQLYALRKISKDLDDAADAARDHLKKKE